MSWFLPVALSVMQWLRVAQPSVPSPVTRSPGAQAPSSSPATGSASSLVGSPPSCPASVTKVDWHSGSSYQPTLGSHRPPQTLEEEGLEQARRSSSSLGELGRRRAAQTCPLLAWKPHLPGCGDRLDRQGLSPTSACTHVLAHLYPGFEDPPLHQGRGAPAVSGGRRSQSKRRGLEGRQPTVCQCVSVLF